MKQALTAALATILATVIQRMAANASNAIGEYIDDKFDRKKKIKFEQLTFTPFHERISPLSDR